MQQAASTEVERNTRDQFVIRPGRLDDIPALVRIWLSASELAHDFVPAAFWHERAEDMADIYLPQSDVLVSEANGRIVAFCAMTGHHLAALFVDPEFQGLGHGSQLLQHLQELHDRIELCVFTKNQSATNFYRRHGFGIDDGQREPHSGEMEYRMSWEANPS